MKKFKFTISGNQYEVEVQSFENDKAQVVVNGTQYEVDVEREKEEAKPVIAPRPAAPKAAGGAGSVKIEAGAAGKVFKVVASAGQAVKKGDTVVILEAMKMEIPVVAPEDGTVASIDVAVGDAVEAGGVLATLN
jgi:biotin carboxyl carrier protein